MDKKYDAKTVELKWRQEWEKTGIYSFDKSGDKPVFSVDTPPPYVSSAHLHVGHAMSYIQAEIITRFRRMQGYNVFYPMGFDDNGLPTERFVEKKYKINKAKISRQEFIDLCLQETTAGAEIYKSIWQKLGIGVDWSLTYNTIGREAQRVAQKSFLDLFKKGLVYRESAPSFWCTKCETALAQADLEGEEIDGVMHYINFNSSSGQKLTIATTRPEMLPACVALYVHPNDDRYFDLIGTTAEVPLFNQKVDILTHSDVDLETGTGLMMVCTWGDGEDIKKWKENGLATRALISTNGRLTDIADQFQGLTIAQARSAIVKLLSERGFIVKQANITHNVNVHERCGTPIEFLASPQWFVKILDHKDKFLQRGNELNWLPDFMRRRYEDWIQGLKWDWCISRNRFYGVPFPVWYCDNCGSIVLPPEQLLPVDPRESAPDVLHCSNCQATALSPELQVMDTWMTSSLTPLINVHWGTKNSSVGKIYPMNLRVQAFEIIRTWLFYTVVKSQYHTESLPWKSVMISGWGLDAQGKKMSKSKGNFVAIEDVLENYPADAVRWWATGAGLGQNLRYTETDIKNGQKIIIKLWNVARFIKPILEQTGETNIDAPLIFADRWILSELQCLIKECTSNLEQCDYNKARIELEKFFWIKYCDNYLELCKDRVWHPKKYSPEQIASLASTLCSSLETILKLFAPIIPHITEEIYHVVFGTEKSSSVHLTGWPTVDYSLNLPALREASAALIEIISRIRHFKAKVIEDYRVEISAISLMTSDRALQEAIQDLAGIAKARKFFVNEQITDGTEYAIQGSNAKIVLKK